MWNTHFQSHPSIVAHMELGTLNFTLGGQTQKFTGIPLVCTCL